MSLEDCLLTDEATSLDSIGNEHNLLKLPIEMARRFLGLYADGWNFARSLDGNVYGVVVAVDCWFCKIQPTPGDAILSPWNETRLSVAQVLRLNERAGLTPGEFPPARNATPKPKRPKQPA